MRSEAEAGAMRVVSYNVHGLRDDRAALTEVIGKLAPDVLVLQEAPRRFRWRHKCAELARGFGMVVAAGGLPAVGNLVLTQLRVTVKRSRSVRFPLTAGRHLRGAVLVDCVVGGVPVLIAGAHLGTDPAERPGHARLLAGELTEPATPTVLGVDVNEEPGGPAWRLLAAGRVDAAEAVGGDSSPTFSCAAPRRRIDAVFVTSDIEVLNYQVVDTPVSRRASDHFPVLTDLRLPG